METAKPLGVFSDDPARREDLAKLGAVDLASVKADARAMVRYEENIRHAHGGQALIVWWALLLGFAWMPGLCLIALGVTMIGDGDRALAGLVVCAVGLACFYPYRYVFGVHAPKTNRLRVLTVEGDALACYVSDNFRKGEGYKADADGLPLAVSCVWRLPLAEVQTIEIGNAQEFIEAPTDTIYDLFMMWRGRRVVLYRLNKTVMGAFTAAQHDIRAMIDDMRAVTPVPVQAAPAVQTAPEKGFSL